MTPAFRPRPRRNCEVFELTCHNCGHPIQIPCTNVIEGCCQCPHCASALVIKWGAAN